MLEAYHSNMIAYRVAKINNTIPNIQIVSVYLRIHKIVVLNLKSQIVIDRKHHSDSHSYRLNTYYVRA